MGSSIDPVPRTHRKQQSKEVRVTSLHLSAINKRPCYQQTKVDGTIFSGESYSSSVPSDRLDRQNQKEAQKNEANGVQHSAKSE